MTINVVQEQFKKNIKPSAAIIAGTLNRLQQPSATLELTRDESFIDGTYDIFDVLARQSAHNETLERSISTTIALLKRSGLMLQEAENKIETQKQRLQKMESLSIIDSASGLLNRRGFISAFSKDMARTQRGTHEGGLLVMFNFENLTTIRKTHGTEAAHMALRLITQALKSESRETDYVARLLDDEFVLLFTNTNMEKALTRLQNMALRLNKLSLIWDSTEISLHLSLGLKSYDMHDKANEIFSAASDDLQRNRKGSSNVKRA